MRGLVIKFGGELLETAPQRSRVAGLAAALAATRQLVMIHGGGRAIDAELARRNIAPRKIDGLRVTDAETLGVVVSVLAGSANTELVAALVAAGVPAVGLTGVDAGFGRARRTSGYLSTSGTRVDLGFVGDPVQADPGLLQLLATSGYVPVVASLGLSNDEAAAATVLNVNADVMACRIAAALNEFDLVIAGGTAGVLDQQGATITHLDTDGIDAVISTGTATAGMVAKLSSCRTALAAGVATIRLIDGRALDETHGIDEAPGTTLVAAARPKNDAGSRFRVH